MKNETFRLTLYTGVITVVLTVIEDILSFEAAVIIGIACIHANVIMANEKS